MESRGSESSRPSVSSPLRSCPRRKQRPVRDRHAHYCIQLAESAEARLQGFEHARWLARLNEDLDNIRLARAWLSEPGDVERLARLAAAMGTYWRYYGSINEGRTWLGEALQRSQGASPSTCRRDVERGLAGSGVGGPCPRKGPARTGARPVRRGRPSPAHRRNALSPRLHANGPWRTAASRSHLERGLALAKGEGDPALEGRLLYGLGYHLSSTEGKSPIARSCTSRRSRRPSGQGNPTGRPRPRRLRLGGLGQRRQISGRRALDRGRPAATGMGRARVPRLVPAGQGPWRADDGASGRLTSVHP